MDKQNYPIVTERVLDVVPPKPFFSRGTHGRSRAEVPQPLASHRLVYLVRGEHVLDTSALALDSATVVDASHVSVVDITTDTEIAVMLTIPSLDATSFTMRVTFLCTVEDPVAVVRVGGPDAVALLSSYLKGDHRIFELGLDYALADVNDLRRKLSARVRAYVTVVPPEFAGVAVELASVEVLTPDELAQFQHDLRTARLKHGVDNERLRGDQLLIDRQKHYEQGREADEKQRVRDMEAAQRAYEREELKNLTDSVGDDPGAALFLAGAAGEITMKEVADEMTRVREQEIAEDRGDVRDRIRYERGREEARWEADREREQAQREIERERERARWDAERTDQEHYRQARLREQEWERDDRRLDREQQRKELEAKLDVIRELAKHGHLDTANLRLDQVVNDMLGGSAVTKVEAAPDADLIAVESASDKADDYGDDTKWSVENAH